MPSRQRLPARDIKIPEGFVLTDEEIVEALVSLNDRKLENIAGFSVEQALGEGEHVLCVPPGCAIELGDLVIAMEKLHQSAEYGNSDITFTFHEGRMVKKGWILLKDGSS